MMTFQEYIRESSGMKTAAAVALTAKISGLNRRVQQDRTTTKGEKAIASQILWLAAFLAVGTASNTGK
jgi:hypothetical protein